MVAASFGLALFANFRATFDTIDFFRIAVSSLFARFFSAPFQAAVLLFFTDFDALFTALPDIFFTWFRTFFGGLGVIFFNAFECFRIAMCVAFTEGLCYPAKTFIVDHFADFDAIRGASSGVCFAGFFAFHRLFVVDAFERCFIAVRSRFAFCIEFPVCATVFLFLTYFDTFTGASFGV